MIKRQKRKLAAIMFTDIAEFTKKMSFDEDIAVSSVKKKRSIILPLIKDISFKCYDDTNRTF